MNKKRRSQHAGRRRGDSPPWRLLLVTIVAFCLCAEGSRAADDVKGMLLEDLQIDGGILDFVKEKNAVVIRNYAVLTFGETKIQARNMVYHYESKEVFAEGDVVFEDPSGSSFYCDRLFFHTGEWRGIAEGVRLKAERKGVPVATVPFVRSGAGPTLFGSSGGGRTGPNSTEQAASLFRGEVRRMAVTAKTVRSINRKHQEGVAVKVSPSQFAEPHWHIYSRAVNFRKGEKIESWHNFIKIGRIPVFYFPYIIKDLKYDWPWVRIGGGYSDDWGTQIYSKWGLDLDPDPKAPFRIDNLFFDLDWRQERGWAYGVEAEYEVGQKKSWGFLDTYFTRETAMSRSQDMDRATGRNDSRVYAGQPNWTPDLYRDDDRYSVDWWHRQEFNDNLDLRMELHKYSDRDFRREYNEWSFKEAKEPETSADLRFQNDHLFAELVATKRLNGWQSQPEYLPELRLSIPSYRLWNSPLYFESDTRVGSVNYRFDEAFDRYNQVADASGNLTSFGKVKTGDDYGTFTRIYNESRLTMPVHLGRWAVLTPNVGGRFLYVGDQYGDNGDRNNVDDYSSALLWGAELSSRFYGVFTDWRHIIEPSIRFSGNEDPDIEADQLYPIDEIEAYDEEHVFDVALRNRWQKRLDGGGYRDFALFDLHFRHYPRDNEADVRNFGRNTTEVEMDLNLYPTSDLRLWSNALVDSQDGAFNRLYVGFDWIFRDRVRVYGTHAYYRGKYWRYPNNFETNSTTMALRTLLWDENSKYSAEFACTYYWSNNPASFDGFAEERITLYRDLDTFELGVSFVNDKQDNDKGIFLQLVPKGFMGFDRPFSATDNASRQLEKSRYGAPAAHGTQRTPEGEKKAAAQEKEEEAKED